MTTELTTLLFDDDDFIEEKELFENEILKDFQNISLDDLIDFSLSAKYRIQILDYFFNESQDNLIEVINRITGMYQFSGNKALQTFLIDIIYKSQISTFLKLECVKSLLSFQEYAETISEKDEEELKKVKQLSNEQLEIRNQSRFEIGSECLNYICQDLSTIPKPYAIECICILMEFEQYKKEASTYFNKIINDESSNCDFRYKTILSLETKVKRYNNRIKNVDFFIKEALTSFFRKEFNLLMYRLLACQYLLQNFKDLTKDEIQEIEILLFSFATNELNEYNLRADAADVLLSLGNEEMKTQAKQIIKQLGSMFETQRTIFDNAQNVHVKEIEDSVKEIVNLIITYPNTIIINEKEEIVLTVDYIENDIKEKFFPILKEDQKEKILFSLNRIKIDRVLYSSLTLSNIFIKLYSYIIWHVSFTNEMLKRLIEELEDMSGTCSSGFLSRLMNVLSGFGEVSLRISFDDQIVSNFTGRLNAYARRIPEKTSLFYVDENLYNKILDLYLYEIDYKGEFQSLEEKRKHYLRDKDYEEEKESQIDDFFNKVLSEMTIISSNYKKRQNFLLFFQTYLSTIREELLEEFKSHVSTFEFDLMFRKAISIYEEGY